MLVCSKTTDRGSPTGLVQISLRSTPPAANTATTKSTAGAGEARRHGANAINAPIHATMKPMP